MWDYSIHILGEKEQSSSLLFVILNKTALYILGDQAGRQKTWTNCAILVKFFL
jgi:hypothetical protein